MSNDNPLDLPKAYITLPAPCPYLPGLLEQRILMALDEDPAAAAEQLNFFTRLGFRRSQQFIYRPNCMTCNACQSYRIRVADYRPTPSQARILRKNKDLWWQRDEKANLLQLYGLFARYQQQRHAGGGMERLSYTDFVTLMEAPTIRTGLYTLARANQTYLGAVLVDQIDDGLSAVYSFYDAEERTKSLGTTLILKLIDEARKLKLPYVYLGYWVKGSDKMDYKARFKPSEILTENGWVDFVLKA